MVLLSLLLSLVFFALALLHFYWAFGGEWGFKEALPTNEQGELVLTPKTIDCVSVGIGLLTFGLFYLFKPDLLGYGFPNWLLQLGAWGIPSIFFLRAIGDFRYVGFFKKIRQTTFGKMDTQFYAPLCLFLALAGFLLNWL